MAENKAETRPKTDIRVHFWAASLQANLLQRGTTAILDGSYTLSIYFGVATTQMSAYLQKMQKRLCSTQMHLQKLTTKGYRGSCSM